MKVLIVDDSRAMQTIVRRGIEQLGYDDMEIRNANNGKEALDVIRVWEPDLVLSDWHMPEMSGMELLRSLNRQMLGVQIGFVTTETSEQRRHEAIAAGAKFFVQKPFDYKTLHEAVIPILQGNSEGEEALATELPHNEESNHVQIPDITALEKILKHFSKTDMAVESSEGLTLEENNFPCLLGLYEEPAKKTISAIAIMDLDATCIIGACVTAIEQERVQEAIDNKVVPKAILGNCKKIMEAVSTVLFQETNTTHLQLRSINIMRRNVDQIKKLLNKPEDQRIDAQVTVKRYGKGQFSIISA